MKFADLVRLNEARSERRRVVAVTNLNSGDQTVHVGSEAVEFEAGLKAGGASRDVTSDQKSPDRDRRFVNVYLPPPRIVIVGAVHISQSLAALAQITAFDVLIIDPRTAFATPDRFQNVEVVAEWPEDVLRTRPLDQSTALVALSHDPRIDDSALASGLRQNCFYVGALGSRKTHAKRLERLAGQGFSETLLHEIKGPIGIDIGAKTPPEIAVAILAEIIQAWRQPNEVAP